MLSAEEFSGDRRVRMTHLQGTDGPSDPALNGRGQGRFALLAIDR